MSRGFRRLRWGRRYEPITLIAVHGDVVLARVGQQEDDCHVLLYGGGTRPDKVPVIEKPREGSVVLARSSLDCLVWLFQRFAISC
jgi:hypothetical protein